MKKTKPKPIVMDEPIAVAETTPLKKGQKILYEGMTFEVIDNVPGDGYDHIIFCRIPGGVNQERKIMLDQCDVQILDTE